MKITLILLLILVFSVPVISAENEKNVTQVSTINAILEGLYDGEITFGELKKFGNFGLGYFHELGGVVIGLDGEFFRFKENGLAEPAKDNDKSPFFTIVNFKPDNDNYTNRKFSYDQLKEYLYTMMPRKKSIYAIKIFGTFPKLQATTFPRQMKPYLPLAKILKTLVYQTFTNTEGALVGFYIPEIFSDLNIPGFHFHFLQKNKLRGGHIVDVNTDSITIEIVEISSLKLILPGSSQFQKSDLSRNYTKDLGKLIR
ncbi:MAG: acetolactate decarboxylase [Acidobacteriota bacterium]